jgi:hypothetical protein
MSQQSPVQRSVFDRQLVTEIHIAAAPAEVWSVLTDFTAFTEWNPFITEATGSVAVGSRLEVRMEPPGGRAMTFKPLVTEATEPVSFEWLGRVLMSGMFDGRHRFDLEETAGGTRLTHSERFTGLMVPILARALDTRIRAGFVSLNEALKTRVEGMVRDTV